MTASLPGLTRAATALALLSGGCTLPDDPDRWHDQLIADSPCYRVDLTDGLDVATGDEVHDLFGCVDHQGHLDALVPLDEALDADTRRGDDAAIDVARAVNALPSAGLDLTSLAGVGLDLLDRRDDSLDGLLDVALELTYAVPAAEVRDPDFALTDPVALRAGVLAPLVDVIPAVARAALDYDLAATTLVGERLAASDGTRTLRTLASLARSPDPRVQEPAHALLADLGDAIVRARSPGNDTWRYASGDSLRDLLEAFVIGAPGQAPAIDAMAPDLAAILGDPAVRGQLAELLVETERTGPLHGLAEDLAWLASVDGTGGTLVPGELSALQHLARLLHDTNRPMACSIDLGLTTLRVDLGNLAVSLLEALADVDPDTVQTGSGILGDVLGWNLSGFVLDSIVSSRVCPALTADVVDSLDAVGVLYDDRSHDATVVFLGLLQALQNGQGNRIPHLVEVLATLHATGAMPAVDELVRDLDDATLIAHVVALVPVLANPGAYGITADGDRATDLHDVLAGAHDVFVVRGGRTDWDRIAPIARAAVAEDGTWEAVAHLGRVLTAPGARTPDLLTLSVDVLDADPDGALASQVGRLLADRAFAEPALRVLETPAVADALLLVSPRPRHPEVPLAFGARLVVDGTLADLLTFVDAVLGTLSPDDANAR